jgi:hypothetical protein
LSIDKHSGKSIEVSQKLKPFSNTINGFKKQSISHKKDPTKSITPRVKELLQQLEEKNDMIRHLNEENKTLSIKVFHLKESVNKLLIKNNELERINKHKRLYLNDSSNSIKKDYSYDNKETQNSTPKSTSYSTFKSTNNNLRQNKKLLYVPEDDTPKSNFFQTNSFSHGKKKNISKIMKKEINLSDDIKFPVEPLHNKPLDFQLNQIKLRTTKLLQSYFNLAKRSYNYSCI